MGNSFGKRTALGSNFGKGTFALKNNNFGTNFPGQLYKEFRGLAFNNNFPEQLSGAALENSLWGTILMYGFEELQPWGNSFGQQLLVATLRRSFRELLCRMALGSRFGEQVCRTAALG